MADYNSSLPVRTQSAGDVIVKLSDATITSQQLAVESDGSINVNFAAGAEVKITDGTDDLAINADGSLNAVVSATDLDIRNLDYTQDSVEVRQATHDNLNLNANLQVGNTDVANGNPVPISDAGGSITVDASDLDIRDLNSATDSVTVVASNLDIRDLTHASDSIKVGDGSDFLAINSDGSINVVPQEDAGTERVNYDTTASVAAGASDNHDFVFTNASKLYQVLASASGKLKVEVQIETGSATNTFNTVLVAFNSTSTPNIDLSLSKYASVPAGARVRVIRTNRDNQAMDVYSTIVGLES